MTAPTHLPDTARAMVAYDHALDRAWAQPSVDAEYALIAAGNAVRDAWIDEGGEPGATLEHAIRSAVDAYEATLCAHCEEQPHELEGELCRECEAVERQDHADFERSHSAWRLG
jgi:hypothetical protein